VPAARDRHLLFGRHAGRSRSRRCGARVGREPRAHLPRRRPAPVAPRNRGRRDARVRRIGHGVHDAVPARRIRQSHAVDAALHLLERHDRLGERVGDRHHHDGPRVRRLRHLVGRRTEGSHGMNERRPVAATLAVAGYIIMIVPILFVVATAFTGGETLKFPPEGFSLRWFGEALSYQPFMGSLVTSLEIAIISTVLALAVGVPVTLAIYRGALPGKGIVENLFLSPLIVPELV